MRPARYLSIRRARHVRLTTAVSGPLRPEPALSGPATPHVPRPKPPTLLPHTAQASNSMWVRPGWEAAVRTAGFSLGQDAVRWAPPLEVAAAHPFYRNVTTRGRHSWTYHEGSFYPMNELQAFRARLDAWLTAALQAARLAPRPHAVVSPMEGCDSGARPRAAARRAAGLPLPGGVLASKLRAQRGAWGPPGAACSHPTALPPRRRARRDPARRRHACTVNSATSHLTP